MNKILTLDDYRPVGSPTTDLLLESWPFWLEPYTGMLGMAKAPETYAEVNHSRWIVHCPFPGCKGATMASRREHRFFCSSCLHAADPTCAKRWLPVIWPDEKVVVEIEKALLARPEPENRNWNASETVRILQMENVQHLGDTQIEALVNRLLSEDDE